MNFLITLLSFLLLFLHPITAQLTSLEPNYTSPLGVKIYTREQAEQGGGAMAATAHEKQPTSHIHRMLYRVNSVAAFENVIKQAKG